MKSGEVQLAVARRGNERHLFVADVLRPAADDALRAGRQYDLEQHGGLVLMCLLLTYVSPQILQQIRP